MSNQQMTVEQGRLCVDIIDRLEMTPKGARRYRYLLAVLFELLGFDPDQGEDDEPIAGSTSDGPTEQDQPAPGVGEHEHDWMKGPCEPVAYCTICGERDDLGQHA